MNSKKSPIEFDYLVIIYTFIIPEVTDDIKRNFSRKEPQTSMSRHLISVKNKQAFINVKDGSYYVEVKANKKHSCQQRRYYFGVVIPMMTEGFNDMGYDFDEDQTHEEVKKMFLSKPYFLPDGTETKVAGSTKKLTSSEYAELTEKCKRWSAEWLSINIPDPGQQIEISLTTRKGH